jgi:hypothetical protein
MRGLYGSEYWTHLLPRGVGAEMSARLTKPPFTAIGARRAGRSAWSTPPSVPTWRASDQRTCRLAEALASHPWLANRLEDKRRACGRDE